MRALVVEDFGAAPAFRDLPTPVAGPGEVRVRVRAASVNGFDLAVAGGVLRGMMEHRFPVVLGKDFAGVVDAVGEGVSGFAAGDRVFGVVMRAYVGDGSFAEYVTVAADIGLAHIPDSLDDATAAAGALVGAAAYAALDAAHVGDGTTLLVCGATGGVGTLAVQLATARGAHVIATAQPGPETDLVRGLGARDVVDHTGDLAAQVRVAAPDGVDAALHLAGDPLALLELVRPGGRLASTIGFGPDQAGAADVTVTPANAMPTQDVLERLAAELTSGRLRLPIQQTYPLEQAPQALADFAAGTRGKLLIHVA